MPFKAPFEKSLNNLKLHLVCIVSLVCIHTYLVEVVVVYYRRCIASRAEPRPELSISFIANAANWKLLQ